MPLGFVGGVCVCYVKSMAFLLVVLLGRTSETFQQL